MVGGLRVLLVEDDPVVRKVIGALLGRLGHQVIVCGGIEQAAAALDDGACPDVALVDLRLGAGSGRALLATLRESQPTMRLVAMSGAPPTDVLDVDGFLEKPCTAAKLAEAISSASR